MTLSDNRISRQLAGRHRQYEPVVDSAAMRPHRSASTAFLPVSAGVIISAAGVLLAADAYTAGRFGYANSAWADRAYWLGQAFIVLPAAALLLSQRLIRESEAVTLVVVLTVAEYVLKICYSPTAFTFADELEHWRSTVNVLHSGNLSTVNYLLPISPHYPGLEEVTAALASVSGFSVYISGLIIAGTAHLLFVCTLYLLFRNISRSYRIAGVAVLLYSSNPDLASFDSMFLYQTLALAFLGLAMLAAWHVGLRQKGMRRASWLTIATVAILATVVTHHVTSVVLAAVLVLVTMTSLVTGYRRSAACLAALTLLCGGGVACWVAFAAPGTVGYLRPFAAGVLHSFQGLLSGGHIHGPSTAAAPFSNRVLGAAAVLLISVLVPIGWHRVWRRYRRQTWIVSMAVGAVTWYAIVAVRFMAADGSELAGRAATFVFIPVSLIAALGLTQLVGVGLKHRRRFAAAGAVILVLALIFNGMANGWPPYWERLPGAHQVAGFERSVGPEEIAGAKWALATLGPGNRFAADFGNFPVLGTYGDQDPVRDDSYLYLSSNLTLADVVKTMNQAIRYVLVDRRLSQFLPASGQYFPDDPNAGKYKRPLPADGLAKWNHVAHVSRIYDSGNIVIYDIRGMQYAP